MVRMSLQRIAALLITGAVLACGSHPLLAAAPDSEAAAPSVVQPAPGECNPPPDADRPQYIVGYGSLMQDESRQRTSPHSGPAHPIEIEGYRRGWFARGQTVGFSTTYLGAVRDGGSHLNAVI